MALKMDTALPIGFTARGAYYRVETPMIALDKVSMSFRLRCYVAPDKPAFDDTGFWVPYDINGANPIAQAYAHLKTLPEFAGAVDA